MKSVSINCFVVFYFVFVLGVPSVKIAHLFSGDMAEQETRCSAINLAIYAGSNPAITTIFFKIKAYDKGN